MILSVAHKWFLKKLLFSITEPELKCLLYAVSKIKPHDKIDQEYVFDFQSFYTFFPDQKDPQVALKATLLSLDQKNWWREITPGVECAVKLFSEIKINQHMHCVSFRFEKLVLSKYLIPTAKHGHRFLIANVFAFSQMKCMYSLGLCLRLMVPFLEKGSSTQVIEITELKNYLSCQQYENYSDFVKRVIVPALKDINRNMFFSVDYDIRKTGNKVSHLIFHVAMKDGFWQSHPFDICNEIFALVESNDLK